MLKSTRRAMLAGSGSLVMATALSAPNLVRAEEKKILKIGQIGVMSGAEASWGLVSKYSALATAAMYNSRGGAEISGEKYHINVVSVDDKDDPKLAVPAGERLTLSEGIKYVIGPNTDTPSASFRPIAERDKVMYFSYAWLKSLYTPPAQNAVLSNAMSNQTSPVIFQYLRDHRGIKKVAFVTTNIMGDLAQRDLAVDSAKKLGLDVVASDDTYETGATDFFSVMTKILAKAPDLIVMIVVAPANAPQLIRAGRELGYKGLFSADSSQDIKILNESVGDLANGLLSLGGGSTPEIRSPYMEEFMDNYVKVAGEWNDEAGTKAYAMEMILRTLQKAGKDALEDIEVFKKVIPDFAVRNPFLKEDRMLRYVGEAYFGQKRQIGLPLVITEVQGGAFKPVYVGQLS